MASWTLSLDHVQITIPSGAEEEARAFYCGLLGLCEVPKPEPLRKRGGFWLQLGSQQIHVGTEEFDGRAHTRAHIAYRTDDLAAVRGALEERGVVVKESVAIPGVERFEIRDPFGNRVEFLMRLSV